jgi:hypothetical protein
MLKKELEDQKQIHFFYMNQIQVLIKQKAIAAPNEIIEHEPEKEEKPTQKIKKKEVMPDTKANKTLLEKICKNCQQPFFTDNKRKETCSGKCRVEFSRKKINQ